MECSLKRRCIWTHILFFETVWTFPLMITYGNEQSSMGWIFEVDQYVVGLKCLIRTCIGVFEPRWRRRSACFPRIIFASWLTFFQIWERWRFINIADWPCFEKVFAFPITTASDIIAARAIWSWRWWWGFLLIWCVWRRWRWWCFWITWWILHFLRVWTAIIFNDWRFKMAGKGVPPSFIGRRRWRLGRASLPWISFSCSFTFYRICTRGGLVHTANRAMFETFFTVSKPTFWYIIATRTPLSWRWRRRWQVLRFYAWK